MDIHESGLPAPRSAITGKPTTTRSEPRAEPGGGTNAGISAAPNAPASPADPSTNSPQTEIGRRVKLVSIASDRETLLHGRRAFERGEDEAALESFTRLATHGVRYADVHYMLGLLQERRGEPDTAIAHLKEAVRINPSYVEALLALASLHERRGEFENSQAYAERASGLARGMSGNLDPTTRGKLANQQAALADSLALAGERREAIEEYRRALERCPNFHDIRHRLGVTLREAGLPAQAAAEFKRILDAHPGLLESQIQLGLTYYSIGRTPDAIREWDAVLEKDPSRDEARMYLRLVRGSNRLPSAPSISTANIDAFGDGSDDLSFAAIATSATPGTGTKIGAPQRSLPSWSKTPLTRSPAEAPRVSDEMAATRQDGAE